MKKVFVLFIVFLPLITSGQQGPLIGNEIGILELHHPEIEDRIILYNEDETVWMSFDFTYEEIFKKQGKLSFTMNDVKSLYKWQEEFDPYGFKIGYMLLFFKCISFDGNFYAVEVNNDKLIKYIRNDKFWILRNWEEHILNTVASVGINFDMTPLHTEPDSNSNKIHIDEEKLDPAICPVEIKSNWLKVKYWYDDEESHGWIRWIQNKQILVSIWYLM